MGYLASTSPEYRAKKNRGTSLMRWAFDGPEHEKCRGPHGKRHCRLCGAEVPKGRRTWCGPRCVARFGALANPRGFLFERDGGACVDCGVVGEPWEADHDVPLHRGGRHSPENLKTRCVPCHREKTKRENIRRYS